MVARYPNSLGHTIRSAAKELKVGHETLRRAIKNGDVRTTKFAGVNRITFQELARLRKLFKRVGSLDDDGIWR